MGKRRGKFDMNVRLAIIILVSVLILFLGYKFLGVSRVVEQPKTQPVSKAIQESDVPTLTYRDIVYTYSFFLVDDPNKLTLIPNFTSPAKGTTLATRYQCVSAINGGFYSTDNTPLGAFITTDYAQTKPLASSLFNGFFAISNTQSAITKNLDTDFSSALQSGPILIWDTQPVPLAIRNDEYARRTVVIKTTDNFILFMTLYIQDSIYNGPLLGDLPMILTQAAKDQGISLSTALNLDGGSAAYFKTPDIELPELSPIGSMFCLTK